MIRKTEKGYEVLSENGSKKLGGPYPTREQAEKRLHQVEYFKSHDATPTGGMQRRSSR